MGNKRGRKPSFSIKLQRKKRLRLINAKRLEKKLCDAEKNDLDLDLPIEMLPLEVPKIENDEDEVWEETTSRDNDPLLDDDGIETKQPLDVIQDQLESLKSKVPVVVMTKLPDKFCDALLNFNSDAVSRNVPLANNGGLQQNKTLRTYGRLQKNVPLKTNVPVFQNVPSSTEFSETQNVQLSTGLPVTQNIQLRTDLSMPQNVPLFQNVSQHPNVLLKTNVPETKKLPLNIDMPIQQNEPLQNVPLMANIPLLFPQNVSPDMPHLLEYKASGQNMPVAQNVTKLINLPVPQNLPQNVPTHINVVYMTDVPGTPMVKKILHTQRIPIQQNDILNINVPMANKPVTQNLQTHQNVLLMPNVQVTQNMQLRINVQHNDTLGTNVPVAQNVPTGVKEVNANSVKKTPPKRKIIEMNGMTFVAWNDEEKTKALQEEVMLPTDDFTIKKETDDESDDGTDLIIKNDPFEKVLAPTAVTLNPLLAIQLTKDTRMPCDSDPLYINPLDIQHVMKDNRDTMQHEQLDNVQETLTDDENDFESGFDEGLTNSNDLVADRDQQRKIVHLPEFEKPSTIILTNVGKEKSNTVKIKRNANAPTKTVSSLIEDAKLKKCTKLVTQGRSNNPLKKRRFNGSTNKAKTDKIGDSKKSGCGRKTVSQNALFSRIVPMSQSLPHPNLAGSPRLDGPTVVGNWDVPGPSQPRENVVGPPKNVSPINRDSNKTTTSNPGNFSSLLQTLLTQSPRALSVKPSWMPNPKLNSNEIIDLDSDDFGGSSKKNDSEGSLKRKKSNKKKCTVENENKTWKSVNLHQENYLKMYAKELPVEYDELIKVTVRECSLCGYFASTRYKLITHMQTHLRVKIQRLEKCLLCDVNYTLNTQDICQKCLTQELEKCYDNIDTNVQERDSTEDYIIKLYNNKKQKNKPKSINATKNYKLCNKCYAFGVLPRNCGIDGYQYSYRCMGELRAPGRCYKCDKCNCDFIYVWIVNRYIVKKRKAQKRDNETIKKMMKFQFKFKILKNKYGSV